MEIQRKIEATTEKAKAQIQKAEEEFLSFTEKLKERAQTMIETTEVDAKKDYSRAKKKMAATRKKWNRLRKEKKTGSSSASRIMKSVMATAIALAAKKHKVLDLVEGAYEKLGSAQDRKSIKDDGIVRIKLMLRMLKAYYGGGYAHVPWEVVVKIVAGMVYFVLLVDLVPDFIPFVGYVDDLVVIMWVYNSISDELDRFKEWEDRKLYI